MRIARLCGEHVLTCQVAAPNYDRTHSRPNQINRRDTMHSVSLTDGLNPDDRVQIHDCNTTTPIKLYNDDTRYFQVGTDSVVGVQVSLKYNGVVVPIATCVANACTPLLLNPGRSTEIVISGGAVGGKVFLWRRA